ncbi:MAG: NAD(+)/NADH kinase [Acidimicrobiales bacterium]
MVATTTVGIIANPASARDIRRIVAHGGAVTTHDKLNRLQRLLVGLSSSGVERVITMADGSGITAGLLQLADRPSACSWPALKVVDQLITRTDTDSRVATKAMVDAGVGAIVVLGGDGTNRIVAGESGDVPLVSISTGTNNAFPLPLEPTVAGLAAGLIAASDDCRRVGTYRAKKLVVHHRDRTEDALVDVAISDADGVGAGAVWNAASVLELFLCFAEPDAIGLSSIGGHLHPVGRREPGGLAIALGEPAVATVRPPIGPGLVEAVDVRSISTLVPEVAVEVRSSTGVVAVDGERLFRFGSDDRPSVTLRADGPCVVDVSATLAYAAANGLLAGPDPGSTRTPDSDSVPDGSDPTRPPQKGNAHDVSQPARPLHRDGSHPAVRVPNLAGVPR